jgi:hypothetical protein
MCTNETTAAPAVYGHGAAVYVSLIFRVIQAGERGDAQPSPHDAADSGGGGAASAPRKAAVTGVGRGPRRRGTPAAVAGGGGDAAGGGSAAAVAAGRRRMLLQVQSEAQGGCDGSRRRASAAGAAARPHWQSDAPSGRSPSLRRPRRRVSPSLPEAPSKPESRAPPSDSESESHLYKALSASSSPPPLTVKDTLSLAPCLPAGGWPSESRVSESGSPSSHCSHLKPEIHSLRAVTRMYAGPQPKLTLISGSSGASDVTCRIERERERLCV